MTDDIDASSNEPEEFLPAPSAPMDVARVLLDDYLYEGSLAMRQWRGGWMRWERTHWAEIEPTIVRGDIYKRLEHAMYMDGTGKKTVPKEWKPNRYKVADVLDAMSVIMHLPETVDPPAWLTAEASYRAGEMVSCSNGLLHVGTRQLYKHSPAYFNRVAVPFDYSRHLAEPVKWLRFLDELWPDDPDSIAALQEFFGYVLSGRTDMHKIMLLIGPTRSGKGTIARVLAAMLGKGNAAGPTLASLGSNFGLSPLLGRPLAVVSDARLGGRTSIRWSSGCFPSAARTC